jgi:Domain of unknown function (DUF4440)
MGGRNEVYSEGVSKKRNEWFRQYQHISNADRVQHAKWGCTRRSSTASEGTVNMKKILVTVATFLVMFAAAAHAADDTEALIALDKQWGESVVKGDTTVSEKLLADKVVSVDENGVMGKQAVLADIKPAPAGTRYEATGYKVTFMNPDTAIMTHSTKGADAHYSLHVWSRKGGTWQIVATSMTNAKTRK